MKWLHITLICLLLSGSVLALEDSPEPYWDDEYEELDFPPEVDFDAQPGRRADLTDLLDDAEPLMDTIEGIEQHIQELRDLVVEEIPPEGIVLNVRQCVDLALTQNAQVFVEDQDVLAAEARIGQARSAMFPQINSRYSITRTEYGDQDFGGGAFQALGGGGGSGIGQGIGRLFADTSNPLLTIGLPIAFNIGESLVMEQFTPDFGPDDTIYTAEVSLRQVLYAGGQIRSSINASRYLAESQEWRREAALAELEYQTKQAFYDAFLTSALVQVANESVKTFERNLSDAEQMYDVGMISNFEVLRAQTELGARKADRVAAENANQLALANLRRLIFIPQDTPVALKPDIDWEPTRDPVDAFVQKAYEGRPEIRALQRAIDASDQNIRGIRGQYKPQVAANVQFQDIDGAGPFQQDGWTFTLGAEWEIGAGGRRKHERIGARAERDGLRYQLQDLERLVELDVNRAYIQIQDAMAQVHSERGTVELAREGLRLAELRFQEGVGTQSEILDAELAQTNAETNLIQALRDYAVANAALERATGDNWHARRALENRNAARAEEHEE